MTDEKKLNQAKNVYDLLCEMLDEKEIKYEKHEEDLVVLFIMGGEDIPMHFLLNVDAERSLIRLLSPLPFVFEGDKKVLGAIAACQANYNIADGSFDYDYKEGKILFRLTASYLDSLISKDLLEYMILVSCITVDEYNDKMFMLSKGNMTLEQFFAE